ncbi:MAG TPA: hypothetical protein VN522_03290 [Solirubrobacterales bacterium]|nr:hypothetical protein [Solirubrobacterales bacterium]
MASGRSIFDSRSFQLNDEITLAVHSERFCETLVASFVADIERSEEMDPDRWRHRGPLHRVKELATAVGRREV